jgi:hypothetical protein
MERLTLFSYQLINKLRASAGNDIGDSTHHLKFGLTSSPTLFNEPDS